jgi:hypothetical protein
MYLLLEAATKSGSFPVYFVAVYVLGFIAAVSIGSIAWYNSKRPAGWEDSSRPDIIPKIDLEGKSEGDK